MDRAEAEYMASEVHRITLKIIEMAYSASDMTDWQLQYRRLLRLQVALLLDLPAPFEHFPDNLVPSQYRSCGPFVGLSEYSQDCPVFQQMQGAPLLQQSPAVHRGIAFWKRDCGTTPDAKADPHKRDTGDWPCQIDPLIMEEPEQNASVPSTYQKLTAHDDREDDMSETLTEEDQSVLISMISTQPDALALTSTHPTQDQRIRDAVPRRG